DDNVWDGRLGDVGEGARGSAKWTKRNHIAVVKVEAIAWCPSQPALLASGGGTNDATINVWNTTIDARLHFVRMPSRVTSIQWAPHRKEILSTRGHLTNSTMVHTYPTMERLVEIRDSHDSRVLFSCVSPAGDMVYTSTGDKNLKFWRIWEVAQEVKKKVVPVGEDVGGGRLNSTKEGTFANYKRKRYTDSHREQSNVPSGCWNSRAGQEHEDQQAIANHDRDQRRTPPAISSITDSFRQVPALQTKYPKVSKYKLNANTDTWLREHIGLMVNGDAIIIELPII
ncbi:hypothetical protein BDQ12DRAFT_671887, partial [Crucibulum laeve]